MKYLSLVLCCWTALFSLISQPYVFADEAKIFKLPIGTSQQFFSRIMKRVPDTPYAIGILMYKMNPSLFHWTSYLNHEDFTIYFLEDTEKKNEIIPFESLYPLKTSLHKNHTENRFILHLNNSDLDKRGYTGMNYIKGRITAWEKAMYLFGELKPHYQQMWIFEDDVLVPTVQAFLSVHRQSIINQTDLIGNEIRASDDPKETVWRPWTAAKTVKKYYSAPLYHGMACAIGLSREMMKVILQFRAKAHRFEFLEVMFYTLAKKENMTTSFPLPLQTVRFRRNYTCENISTNQMNWYHPIKQQSLFLENCQRSWDQRLQENQFPIFQKPVFDPLGTKNRPKSAPSKSSKPPTVKTAKSMAKKDHASQ